MARWRAYLVPLTLLLAGAPACSGSPAETGAPPLSLASPDDTAATAPGSGPGGGGLAARIPRGPTPEYLGQVASATRAVGTGQVRLVAAATGGRGNENRTAEMSVLEGRYDNANSRSRVRLDPTGAQRAGATGLANLFGGPVEMIQIGTTIYLQLGARAAGTWTKMEGDGASALRPIFDMFKITDVGSFLGALACAGPVSDVARGSIDGVATNQYRVDAKATELKACIAKDPNAGRLLDNVGESERATVDVWVDDSSLVRKLVVTADERALGKEVAKNFPGATSTLTMSLSGFGQPMAIEAPPAGQVTEGSGIESILDGLGDPSGTDPSGGDIDLGDLGDLLSGLG